MTDHDALSDSQTPEAEEFQTSPEDQRYPPAMRKRRLETLAILPVLAGLFLLMPPFIHAFANKGMIFGLPVILVYIFGVWIALILIIARLSPALQAGEQNRKAR